MGNILLHTPEGVRDIYNSECKKKQVLKSVLYSTMESYGYDEIQTPTFEFFDIFSREIGTTPSKDLYKFFDKDGETLVLRPDMTPSVARCVAKYYMDEKKPLRFFYLGNTFVNNHGSYQGRLNETTQIGAEFMGDPGVEAEVEIVALICDCLKKSGLTEFQISIGQVDFFKSILDSCSIEPEDEAGLRELISKKNFFGVEEFLEEKHFPDNVKEIFKRLPNMFGTVDVLQEAKSLTGDKRAIAAIERLEQLYDRLCVYGMEKFVSFDLGMLSKYKYYTGIIIKAYTYGLGEPIVTGGRYDRLLSSFGKDCAAVGFVIGIDQLMLALSRQKIDIPTKKNNVILQYGRDSYGDAVKLAMRLRDSGINVKLLDLSIDHCEYNNDPDISYAIVLDKGCKLVDMTGGDMKKVTEEDLFKILDGIRG
ncbi:MAG: ATP phosphoribosyltransferase regulatory subunit [Lachnospiraceae bacterium]|nr:ATP phosphoribosyltransferase regulatory subunit [Lachnospiraceae bacterium]